MTWPPTLLPPQGHLRPVEHPDLASVLFHFCERGRPLGSQVPPGVRAMTASDRLGSILYSHQLYGYTTFSGGLPAVCFTEASPHGLHFLITRRGYQPWALAVDRQGVYDAGGAPVWYARPEQYHQLGQLDPALRSWAVRLEPGSDFLEEREWRVVLYREPSVPLASLRVIAIVVGDPAWNGAFNLVAPDTTGTLWNYSVPALLPVGLPRWYWNPVTGQLEVAGSP